MALLATSPPQSALFEIWGLDRPEEEARREAVAVAAGRGTSAVAATVAIASSERASAAPKEGNAVCGMALAQRAEAGRQLGVVLVVAEEICQGLHHSDPAPAH